MLFGFLDASLYWLAAIAAIGVVTLLIVLWFVAVPNAGELYRKAVMRTPTLRGRLLLGLFLVGAIPVMTLPPLLALENIRARQLELGDQLRLDAGNLARCIRVGVAGAGLERHAKLISLRAGGVPHRHEEWVELGLGDQANAWAM